MVMLESNMALIRRISNVRLFTTSAACLCLNTKKARIPHDRRYAPNAKDVNERRPGGNKEFRIKYGRRGQGVFKIQFPFKRINEDFNDETYFCLYCQRCDGSIAPTCGANPKEISCGQDKLVVADLREGGTYITGYVDKDDKLQKVPEMVPELIAPDLTDFKLKPYVSYAVPDTIQPEFTAKHLFDATIGKQLNSDYQSGKISLEDVKKNLEDIKLRLSDNETREEQNSETLQHVNKT